MSAECYLFGRVGPFFSSLALKEEETCFQAGGEVKVGTSG